MKIGILGSGAVGVALAKGFMSEGHDVVVATREPMGDKGQQLSHELAGAIVTDFATVAREAEIAVLCVKWDGAEEIVTLAGAENQANKIVIDTSNIIAMEGDTMVYGGDTASAAETVQAWLPDSKVVKAFNTVGADYMYKPQFSETPTMFIAGNDTEAKRIVSDIVSMFGWEALDSGDLVASKELEAMAIVWIRTAMATGAPHAFKML